MQRIRLVIADDHPILREGLKALLASSRQLEVVEARDGKAALDLVEKLQPDVLLLDVDLPDMSGIEVVKQLHERSLAVKILVVTAYDNPGYIRQLLDGGVAGYMLKDEAAYMIVQAVEAVAQGERGWLSSTVRSQFEQLLQNEQGWHDLSQREIQVLREVSLGKTNAAISYALHISEKTVEKHLDNIYRKLDVSSRTGAAVLAAQQGLLDTPDHALE